MYIIKVHEYEDQYDKYRHLRTEERDENLVKLKLSQLTVRSQVLLFYRLDIETETGLSVQTIFLASPYIFDQP